MYVVLWLSRTERHLKVKVEMAILNGMLIEVFGLVVEVFSDIVILLIIKDIVELYMLIMPCYHYFPVILKAMRVVENHHTSILSKNLCFQVHSVYLFGQ
jgi:hypothetical protein